MRKIFILSIKNSSRRGKLVKQLKKLNLKNYAFFDAFDARNKKINELYQIFDINKFKKSYGRFPAKGEIGCTISHIALWNKIIKDNLSDAIILEDDALISKKLSYFIKNYKEDKITILGYSKVSYLRMLYNYISHPTTKYRSYKYFNVGRIENDFTCGTVGYYVTYCEILRLINKLKNDLPYFLADDWSLYSEYIDIYHSRPFLVFENYKKIESTIEKERKYLSKKKYSLIEKVKMLISKFI